MLLYSLQIPIQDPVLLFTLVLFIILISPYVLKFFRMPGLIGLIISGMILGPHASGILERDQSIVLFGKVGILYIMFTAGLEIDLVEFSKSRIKIITFG
ncbi:MAG: cation:proton antiporter, partial [Leptospiraceae bacterium]|nr:cation:proton antiporter [Leptospiraceae bacterium]